MGLCKLRKFGGYFVIFSPHSLQICAIVLKPFGKLLCLFNEVIFVVLPGGVDGFIDIFNGNPQVFQFLNGHLRRAGDVV